MKDCYSKDSHVYYELDNRTKEIVKKEIYTTDDIKVNNNQIDEDILNHCLSTKIFLNFLVYTPDDLKNGFPLFRQWRLRHICF